jgi:hypothetical protein
MACLTNYAIQCTDVTSNKTGCFLFDEQHWQKTGEFKAVSQIYPDLVSFYANTDPVLRHSTFIERI